MGEKDFSHRSLGDDAALWFVPPAVFQRVRDASLDATLRVPLLADLCRINTLYMIMRAGSGHIGSSFSSMDLITWLWTQELHEPNSGDAGIRRLLLVEGARRAGALLAAHRAREARFRSRPQAAADRRPARASRRGHAVHRHQHRLARHGHLEGVRDGARESLHAAAADACS